MEQIMEQEVQRRKIHPHKFALWVAMGSISMMFAGLTSAYMVRESQTNWRYYKLPPVFWYSTIVIVASSITLQLATKAFKSRVMPRYRSLMVFTILLGLIFSAMQLAGFYQLYHQVQAVIIDRQVSKEMEAVRLNGNPSESFLFIIAGLHIVHLLGGIVTLLVVYFRSTRKTVKIYNATALEVAGGYWHFVDALWLYLFVFFLVNQ